MLLFYFIVYKHCLPCYNEFMKVTRELQITGREFFEVVFQNLAGDIRSSDKTEIEIGQFRTGFTYTYHPEDPALRISFEIVEYQEEKLYKAVRTSPTGSISIIYDVTPTENGIRVDYTYEDTALANKKRGFFSGLSDAVYLSHMTDALYSIQRTVINQREGFEEIRANSPFLPNIRKSKQ